MFFRMGRNLNSGLRAFSLLLMGFLTLSCGRSVSPVPPPTPTPALTLTPTAAQSGQAASPRNTASPGLLQRARGRRLWFVHPCGHPPLPARHRRGDDRALDCRRGQPLGQHALIISGTLLHLIVEHPCLEPAFHIFYSVFDALKRFRRLPNNILYISNHNIIKQRTQH